MIVFQELLEAGILACRNRRIIQPRKWPPPPRKRRHMPGTHIKTVALLGALLMARCLRLCAAPEEEFGNDGIDRSDPNFVTASLLIMSPGDELYSCAGHACIRLECPTFNLDYCFSYESESVKEKVLTFFMGKLKMGMFAIPTEDYLKVGRESGRGVMQYRLNLPPDAKQRLWKILDEKAVEGANLPYDHVRRGCAQAVLRVLRQALAPLSFKTGPLPEKFDRSRRESVDIAATGYPWNRFFLHAILGSEADWMIPQIERVVIPADLLDFLRLATVGGMTVIDAPGEELLPQGSAHPAPVVTPMMVAWLFVAMAVANAFLQWKGIAALFLALQTLAGLFFVYLVSVSDLPATGWNWLVVPFNPLPLVFWKWRRKWALWFAGVLVLWEVGMILYPHRLTDPAYLVLVAAYIWMYAQIGCPQHLRQRT